MVWVSAPYYVGKYTLLCRYVFNAMWVWVSAPYYVGTYTLLCRYVFNAMWVWVSTPYYVGSIPCYVGMCLVLCGYG